MDRKNCRVSQSQYTLNRLQATIFNFHYFLTPENNTRSYLVTRIYTILLKIADRRFALSRLMNEFTTMIIPGFELARDVFTTSYSFLEFL